MSNLLDAHVVADLFLRPRAATAPSTRRAYARHWRDFSTWCEQRGLSALPASPETCALFLSAMAERGLRAATIQQALAAITKAHRAADLPSPRTGELRAVARRIRRALNGVNASQRQAAPATAAEIRAMVAALPAGRLGMRDAAMLLVGFAGAFRRSELVGLNREDVRITADGLEVMLRRSKTDQEGAGRLMAVPYSGTPSLCPVRRLQAWADEAGITEGPLFRHVDRHGRVAAARLSGQAVSELVRRAARRAGLDEGAFSGHSLRAGFVTEALRQGLNSAAIARHVGYQNIEGLQRYNRLGMFSDRFEIRSVL